jgi:hypothetical protein
MLFGYPAAAIEDNWFHDCLVEILQTIHTYYQEPQNNKEPLPDWPEIIPEIHREKLSSRRGLRDRLIAYQEAIIKLSQEELAKVNDALEGQNDISALLSCNRSCDRIDNLPKTIGETAKELFTFAFKLLTDLEIRDRQYQIIYERSPYHVCPFCGCEFFDAPTGPREALDHYLAESKYPFAAANLHNLVPMGHKCNSKYKLAQDILYDDEGQRRKSHFPYDYESTVQIKLENSVPFAVQRNLYPFPQWEIEFAPDDEEVITWDTVFHIKERFRRDVLDAEFNNWLREFSSWCKSANHRPNSREELNQIVDTYIVHLEDLGMNDKAFLKAAVFRMLLHHCQQGNSRLIEFMGALIVGGM